jgi:hypothetical protein
VRLTHYNVISGATEPFSLSTAVVHLFIYRAIVAASMLGISAANNVPIIPALDVAALPHAFIEYPNACCLATCFCTSLNTSGKEYASILNIQADTANKSKQSEVLDANKSQTWAQTHKLIADTYVNHGVFTWTGVNANGVTGVSKASTGYTTLSDVQKQVAKQQALGYSMNAWGSAATSSAGMIGTLLAAEIPSMDAATIALYMNRWTTAVDKLNGSVAPEITL